MCAAPFKRLIGLDTEFTVNDRVPDPVEPICLCAHEINSGQSYRIWEDELRGMKRPPFDIGPDTCLIAYAAGAEAQVFARLGWPRPHSVIDLFAEFSLLTNVTPDRAYKPPGPPPISLAMKYF